MPYARQHIWRFENTTYGLSFVTLMCIISYYLCDMDTFLCPCLSNTAQVFMPKT